MLHSKHLQHVGHKFTKRLSNFGHINNHPIKRKLMQTSQITNNHKNDYSQFEFSPIAHV